ncbi:hypothetical protein CCP2SC5_70059 [Azospirillaceae bacterium]
MTSFPSSRISSSFPTHDHKISEALAIFRGDANLPWLRLLRPGFRHCFVAVRENQHWIILDPLLPFTDVSCLETPPEFDLAAWFRNMGMTVVPTLVDRSSRRPAPWGPFTCVEAVKRILGLHDRWVLTPWQLFQRLTHPPLHTSPE